MSGKDLAGILFLNVVLFKQRFFHDTPHWGIFNNVIFHFYQRGESIAIIFYLKIAAG